MNHFKRFGEVWKTAATVIMLTVLIILLMYTPKCSPGVPAAPRPTIHLIRTCRYAMEDGRFGEISNELAEGYVDAFSHGFGQKLDTRCPFSIWKVDSVYVSISVEP